MKIEFKAIRKRIELGEYASELAQEGGHIDVQVNVSRELLARMRAVSVETPDAEFLGMLQELWDEEVRTPTGVTRSWPMEDIQALSAHCRENDPGLWKWITNKTWWLVLEYQGFQKKN